MARVRTFDCALIALLCSLTLGVAGPAAHAKKPRKTIARELNKLYLRGAIDEPTYAADRAVYKDVKRRIRHLRGTRKNELRGVLRTVQGIAARGSLRASRLYPLFLTLQRNAEWWSTQPLLASGQRVTFEDSELIWQYVPGQGLQFHPLANFGRLNAYAKSRRQRSPSVRRPVTRAGTGIPAPAR